MTNNRLIIYLDVPSPKRSINLPTDIRRATPFQLTVINYQLSILRKSILLFAAHFLLLIVSSAYLVFQLMRFTYALAVTTEAVGSYSTFSPLPLQAVIFCCTCCHEFVAKSVPSR